MMKLIQAGIVAVVMSLGCVSAWAGPQEDYRKGWEYFQAKDYAEAVKLYRKAAEQGNASAQFILGNMYSNGEGVPQDYVTAYMWYDLAGSTGNKLGVEYRDKIAKRMTPADVSEAQRRASVCMKSNYKNCD